MAESTSGGIPVAPVFKPDRPTLTPPPSPSPEPSTPHSEVNQPASSVPRSKDQEYFDSFFGDDSNDEDRHMEAIKEAMPTFKHTDKYSEIDARLNASLKELRGKYPSGGFKSFGFITLDILLDAPEDYFSRFEEAVRDATIWVQGNLAEKGQAEIVATSQASPHDVELKDKAFRLVRDITLEYLEKHYYKGIEKQVFIYLVTTDIIGLSRIDPIWNNRSIDEILINGPFDIQIEEGGKIQKVPSIKFRDAHHLEGMLERIFSTIGKSLSRTTPILDGRLYDQSRIAATDRVISPEGPNVAIRRHPEKYWTPMEVIKFGSASEELFTEVGNWIYKGCSYIVIGGTGSGKTSLLNATSGFFHPSQRVLTLEDNLELKMNPKKLLAAALECREPNPNNANDRGITMRDLVKASLRMRPDGIVIGEVRDGAMYDLCQALNTGHWGASSVHANSAFDGIYRMQSLVTQAELVSADAALSLIATGFDFILMQQRFPEDGSRKITMVAEIDPYPKVGENGRLGLGITPLWEYVTAGVDDDGRVLGGWEKVGEMSEERRKRRFLDLTPDLSWEDLVKLCELPEDLQSSH
jgi:pilus assembly protein CpaF